MRSRLGSVKQLRVFSKVAESLSSGSRGVLTEQSHATFSSEARSLPEAEKKTYEKDPSALTFRRAWDDDLLFVSCSGRGRSMPCFHDLKKVLAKYLTLCNVTTFHTLILKRAIGSAAESNSKIPKTHSMRIAQIHQGPSSTEHSLLLFDQCQFWLPHFQFPLPRL